RIFTQFASQYLSDWPGGTNCAISIHLIHWRKPNSTLQPVGQPVSGGSELIGAAQEGEAHEALAPGAERRSGRDSHIRPVDDLEPQAAHVGPAVDGEEQIEGAADRGEPNPPR